MLFAYHHAVKYNHIIAEKGEKWHKKIPQIWEKFKSHGYAHSLEEHVVIRTFLFTLPFVPCLSYILYSNLNYIISPLWQRMCLTMLKHYTPGLLFLL